MSDLTFCIFAPDTEGLMDSVPGNVPIRSLGIVQWFSSFLTLNPLVGAYGDKGQKSEHPPVTGGSWCR